MCNFIKAIILMQIMGLVVTASCHLYFYLFDDIDDFPKEVYFIIQGIMLFCVFLAFGVMLPLSILLGIN